MQRPNHLYFKARRAPKFVRITLGVLLVIGGLLGFLPVLGYWMIPLGIIVLSADFPGLRRRWQRLRAWWARRRDRRETRGSAPASRK